MAPQPFLSELRLFACDFAPQGWAQCNGQLLPINQNQALYSLLGTTYGGDGRTNFALPDLRGRTPIHFGAGYTQGQRAGEEFHTLTVAEMPQHPHQANGTKANADTPVPGDALLAVTSNVYTNASNLTPMVDSSIGN